VKQVTPVSCWKRIPKKFDFEFLVVCENMTSRQVFIFKKESLKPTPSQKKEFMTRDKEFILTALPVTKKDPIGTEYEKLSLLDLDLQYISQITCLQLLKYAQQRSSGPAFFSHSTKESRMSLELVIRMQNIPSFFFFRVESLLPSFSFFIFRTKLINIEPR